MNYIYEIYLTNKKTDKNDWEQLIKTISNYNGLFHKWYLFITFDKNLVRYFIHTRCLLPSSINGLKQFILKETDIITLDINTYKKSYPTITFFEKNALDIYDYIEIKNKGILKQIKITLVKITNTKIWHNTKLYIEKNNIIKRKILLFNLPSMLLAANFETNYKLIFKKSPNYLDISKSLHLLKTNSNQALFKIDTFPYLQGTYYLDLNSINFAKHSIVLGASGTGKSKFISLLINNIYRNPSLKLKYKIIVIDPHASLEKDIGGIGQVIDFHNRKDSINLFSNSKDIIVSVELLLDLFKGLIDHYNPKLERVLRHSLYLLLSSHVFNFNTLRKVLLNLEYRNGLLKENKNLKESVIEFFFSEFNEIKTKSYDEAISPIIAFIDEIEMLPVFNQETLEENLESTIEHNFLTIFSLDRTKLGNRITKTISGLLMQQLLTLVQDYTFTEHIIFIVDEVAVVQNPILSRFLAEARKYNLSLFLAGQYFNQIDKDLKSAIFSNAINYYIFRVAKMDAVSLVENINMKIPLHDDIEHKIKMITDLQDRECLIRIEANNILLPAIKGKTVDFTSIPRVNVTKEDNNSFNSPTSTNRHTKFQINSNIQLKDILIANSSSRKVVKK